MRLRRTTIAFGGQQEVTVRRLIAGFLKLNRPVSIPKRLTLFLVDYPEERREFTRTLLKELAAYPDWPVRLLGCPHKTEIIVR